MADQPRTTNEIIYQTIVDLTSSNRSASRQVISSIAGIKMSIVDDHIKRMVDDGRLRRVVNGIVELAESVLPDRAVSMTYLPTGGCKLEIGDVCLDLTLREARMVGLATGGIGLQFGR